MIYIDNNKYSGVRNWSRYYITKYTPMFLRTFLLNCLFFKFFKSFLNFKNPKTLADKINYLKLYDVTPEKIMLTDKLQAKEYIEKTIPELKTKKVFQICDSFEELDFSKCPDKFVIKTNHACKTNYLVEDKNKITKEKYEELRKYYNKVLKVNFAYWGAYEMQYKDISPKVYIEEFIQNEDKSLLTEYEVFCFNSEPKFIECAFPSRPCATADWEETDFFLYFKMEGRHFPMPSDKHKKKIIEYSKIIAKDFSFVRCDFIVANDELYFAEITFTPYMGNVVFVPKKYDLYWGEQLDISEVVKRRR